MRERALSPRAAADRLHFMKPVRVLPAVVLALALVAPMVPSAAFAGFAPSAALRAPDTPSVAALRALFNRCFPAMSGQGALSLGMQPAAAPIARHLLGERPGAVWADSDGGLFVADYADRPVCKVVVLGIDKRVLGDLVLAVFREEDTPFRQRRFRIDEDGGFAAIYTAKVAENEVVVRIHTGTNTIGQSMATLQIERPQPLAH